MAWAKHAASRGLTLEQIRDELLLRSVHSTCRLRLPFLTTARKAIEQLDRKVLAGELGQYRNEDHEMKTKQRVLSRVASKAVAAGRQHAAKLLEGKETLAEAAGATVKGLFSPAKKISARKTSANKVPAAKSKAKVRKQSTSKGKLSTKKAKASARSKTS